MLTFYEKNFEIFFVEKEAIRFVENIRRLMDIKCLNVTCMSDDYLTLYKDGEYLGGNRYTYNSCKTNIAPIKYMGDDLPKIKMSRLLHLTYLYLHKLINLQITFLISVTEPTYISLKSRIVKSLKRLVDTFKKLGEEGCSVQIDETVCCKRRLIYNPTSGETYSRDTKRVIGVNYETTRKVGLGVLPDRTIPTIGSFIKRTINLRTITKSDGYPSYPVSVVANSCHHIREKHSQGFVDDYGNHTNSIESVWPGDNIEIKCRSCIVFKFRRGCWRI